MYDINEFVNDLTLDIYEAEQYGEITESERDSLLYIVERNKMRGANSTLLRRYKNEYDRVKNEKDKIEKKLSELKRRGYGRYDDVYIKNADKLNEIEAKLRELRMKVTNYDTYKGNKGALYDNYSGPGEAFVSCRRNIAHHNVRSTHKLGMPHQTSAINRRINRRAKRAKMESTFDDFNEAYGLYDF